MCGQNETRSTAPELSARVRLAPRASLTFGALLAQLGMSLFLAAAPTACASAGDAPIAARAAAPTTPEERDARIRELGAAIAEDEEALRVLISAGSSEGDDPLHTSNEMREIANRLPALQDELRELLRAREIAATRAKRARELQNEPQDP